MRLLWGKVEPWYEDTVGTDQRFLSLNFSQLPC